LLLLFFLLFHSKLPCLLQFQLLCLLLLVLGQLRRTRGFLRALIGFALLMLMLLLLRL
jgi:hypothetical protein